jgi:hypothetical protein
MLLPARASVTGNIRFFDQFRARDEKFLNRADIGPALKEAIEITGKGAPYLVEIIAKEGYDFSRHQAHTS